MRALLLFALLAVPIAADETRIREAIALHDAGRYDDAIAIYKSILAEDASNTFAAYELALSLQAKGDHAQCIEVTKKHADAEGELQAGFLTTLGSCLDIAGKHDEAIATFRKGLALVPDEPMLLYNLGVTLWGQQQYAEARELLKKELTVWPAHPSGHYVLAQIFEKENFRAAAILSYLRFLALEPSSARSKDAAARALGLMSLGVTREGPKNVTVNVDAEARREEGDFSVWHMMLGLSAAARTLPEKRRKSEFELTHEQLASSLRMLIEARDDLGASYSARQNVAFFADLEENQVLDGYAAVALSSLNLKGGDRWLKKNDAAVQSYIAYIRSTMH